MAHVSSEELERRLTEAASNIEVGGMYAHYKNPGHLYTVKKFGIWEATDEVAVIYEGPKGGVFIRPASEWLEEVEWEGKKALRFQKH